MDTLINIGLIILGWLFGILSPGIINKISHKYRSKELENIIITELKDIKSRLVWIPCIVLPKYGKLDKETFDWVKTQTDNFSEVRLSDFDDENVKKFKETIDSETNLEKFLQSWNIVEQKDNPAFHFKKMEPIIINSNLINIALLKNNFLTKLIEIVFHIKTFNEEILINSEFLKMTFDSSLSPENHRIIQNEIMKKNYTISRKAIFIVDKINKLLNS